MLTSSSTETTKSGYIEPFFALENASFAIDGQTLLHPLTLSLATGQVIGLIGHNGSGKSTLLKLLARQQPTAGGSVRCLGRDLRNWKEREFARNVAYLPQQPPPAAGMLVRELVALGRYPWHGALGRFGRSDRRKVDEAILLTDIATFADRQVETLSGGERQRVWLAMLMAQDSRCLLLDEPISALDIAHQVEVLTLVRRLAIDRGLGVILVLHDVNMAARFCDEIVALHSGRLIARGTPSELMLGERLEEIYGLPMGILPHPMTGAPISYIL